MSVWLTGVHHVTAMAKDPLRTREFYERVLGLRLVKRTVNFDDPTAHHLYYADRVGSPGTVLTFFPYPSIAPGQPGAGEASLTTLCAPEGSLGFWSQRLDARDVSTRRERTGDGERLLFEDPSGMRLAVVEAPAPAGVEAYTPGEERDIDEGRALRGVFSVTLRLTQADPTEELLTNAFGFRRVDARGEGVVLEARGEGTGRRVELLRDAEAPPARLGGGSVHHVAWRASDAEVQERARETVQARGLRPTPVLDRNYFRSIYFREPGDVIFEIATDGPGFLIDEEEAALGTSLRLPPHLEPRREELEAALPPLSRPE
jgi:glyoxalase family protein